MFVEVSITWWGRLVDRARTCVFAAFKVPFHTYCSVFLCAREGRIERLRKQQCPPHHHGAPSIPRCNLLAPAVYPSV